MPKLSKIFSYLKKYFGAGEKYTYKGASVITELLKNEWVEDFVVKWRIKSPYRVYEKLEKKYHTQDIWESNGFIGIQSCNKISCWLIYMILGVVHKACAHH